MTLTQVEEGKQYVNVHSGRVCTVSAKIFFNIQYYYADDPNHAVYSHYKRFRKIWRK
jgi:hypothetical protein